MYNTLIINVDELWLKGKNRHLYYKALLKHLNDLFETYHEDATTCNIQEQRFVARSATSFVEETISSLLRVPGVFSVIPSRGIDIDFDIEKIIPTVFDEIDSLESIPATFKVQTKRTNKSFPLNSMEVSRKVGGMILSKYPNLRVDVHNPLLVVEIRILKNNIYISSQNLQGIGGLPFGTNGHLVTLISGGFDSPVASFMMSKRGCQQTYIFFHAYPFIGDEVKDKILELMKVLGKCQRHSRIYVVPFGDLQNKIAKVCKQDYRTLLFRKYMIKCAALLAKRISADALLTGDALGQVSSQTIGNIKALDDVVDIPIMRPLIGFNKAEIISKAKEIGTHDVSVIPHDDACSLFAPKHPIIRPDTFYLGKFEEEFKISRDLEDCLDRSLVFNIALNGLLTEVSQGND